MLIGFVSAKTLCVLRSLNLIGAGACVCLLVGIFNVLSYNEAVLIADTVTYLPIGDLASCSLTD